MDRKSLFDLPKEMLIEIILNVKKKHDIETENLMKRCSKATAVMCEYKDCNNFQVKNNNYITIFSKGDDIQSCHICGENYCDDHNMITYFDCCGARQCNNHHYCKTCQTPLCLDCRGRDQCDECI